MNIGEAIKTLDEVIPDPNDKMVDLNHLPIAIAWKTVKGSFRSKFRPKISSARKA